MLLALMFLLACSTPQATCAKPKNPPVGSLPAHSSLPVHFMVSDPMKDKHPPAQEPPPTSGCKPFSYFGVDGCRVLANGKCPHGYHKDYVGPKPPDTRKMPSFLMCV